MSASPEPTSSHLASILTQVLSHARGAGCPTNALLAERAHLAPETISRIKSRGTCDFETLYKLVDAAGLELRVEPKQAASQRSSPGAILRKTLPRPAGWTNPNLTEEALIRSVLTRARYEDILQTAGHFGLERVAAIANDMGLERRPVLSKVIETLLEAARQVEGSARATP